VCADLIDEGVINWINFILYSMPFNTPITSHTTPLVCDILTLNCQFKKKKSIKRSKLWSPSHRLHVALNKFNKLNEIQSSMSLAMGFDPLETPSNHNPT